MVHPQPLPSGDRHPGRSRTGQVVLTVLGVLLILGCGLVTTVVLLLTVGPRPYVVGLLAALLPVVPLLTVFVWLDRYEPEPRGLLVFGFGWGAAVATAGALLLSLPPTLVVQAAGGDPELVGAVVVAPVVEEVLKGLGLLAILVVGRRGLDGIVDGFVYAGVIGVGFAFTENILYLGTALLDGGAGGLVATFLLRGVVSPFAHPLFTAATGVGLVLASRRRGASRLLLAGGGLAVAIGLHALWNGMAVGSFMGFVGTFVVLWVPLFAAFVAVAVVARSREARMIRGNVALYARYGWFSPAEAQMLVSLPARRAAMSRARAAGAAGPMHRFQVTAVRLAHLRQRILAGTQPWDAAAREADLLGALARERPAIGSTVSGGPGPSGLRA
ncbi:PrsW family intramembrane metalloprotease [Aquipuribacter sp. MA13-6]|uniref:PrsW family intramembrane metalloprotease n=1 Tax=unclassified Aquipuribacter TaxID=2635084 RepID=UPI003EEF00EC